MTKIKPTPGPAQVAVVSIGPPSKSYRRIVLPNAIAMLDRMPVVAIDFYPAPIRAQRPQSPGENHV